MCLNRLVNLMIVSLILFSLFILPSVNAEEDTENLIEADFTIELKSATDLKISITADVSKIYLDALDVGYTGSEIASIAVSDSSRMSIIQYALKIMLKNQIKNTFGPIEAADELPVYDSGLFTDVFDVNLTNNYFSLNDSTNVYDFINGVLDMGATVNYTFNLQTDAGWNNTYTFNFGSIFGYYYVNTDLVEGNEKATWKVFNWDGSKPSSPAIIKLKNNNPTTQDLKDEDIDLNFIINSVNAEYTSLTADILIKTADIKTYNILPDFIDNLDFIPADGFRLFVDNGLITWDDVYETTLKPIEEKIKNEIETSSFNQTLDLIRSWDSVTTTDCPVPYEVQNMNTDPALKSIMQDQDINLEICGISNRALFGLINSGAEVNITAGDINFGDNIKNIGYDYNISLYLPEGFYLDDKNIYEWNKTVSPLGLFKSDSAVNYFGEEKDTVIEIEIKTTDLNLLSFLTGKTELTFGLYIQEKREYNVMDVKGLPNIPEKIILPYMNSDAFRVCVEENVFTEEEITTFLENEKELFENRLDNVLPEMKIKNKGQIEKDVFEESLNSWDRDILNMDAEEPIKIDAYAHCSYPASFDLSFLPPRFEVSTLYFNFSGVKNHNVTYRIIFPDGVDLQVEDSLKKATVETRKNGRKYFEIHFDESEYNLTDVVSCDLVLSGLFIASIFMPCIISFIIAVILVITIFIIRKKRKMSKSKPVEEEDLTGYEEEDYYIPPPPDSKE